jgi:hypothetical protein
MNKIELNLSTMDTAVNLSFGKHEDTAQVQMGLTAEQP